MVEKLKILLIDDEPKVTKAIGRLLVNEGYDVIELNDPLKVEDYLLLSNLDLIITDLKMPKRDGIEVLRIIMMVKPEIPVFILTGFAAIDSAIEATKLGAAEYLSKPVNQKELTELINKAFRTRDKLPDSIHDIEDTLATVEPDKMLLPDEIISTETMPEGFVEISFEDIIPGEKIPFSIYIQIYNKSSKKFYLRNISSKNKVYTTGLRNMLFRKNLGTVYISEDGYRDYLKYYSAIKSLPKFRTDQINDKKKLVLYGKAIESVSQILTHPIEESNVQEAVHLIDDIFSTMVKDPDIFSNMYKLFSRETSIFNHSANTCLLTVCFALYLQLDAKVVRDMGVGALFHDIGMSKIDNQILNKAEPLTVSEWQEIKKHPERGAALLKSSLLFPKRAMRIISEHHEHPDGTGYPKGLRNEQISMAAHIVRITDMFDGLTKAQSYRAAFSPKDAIKQIFTEQSSEKTKDLIRKFIPFLGSGEK